MTSSLFYRLLKDNTSNDTIKKPPFIKGPYKLTLTGLDTNLKDAVLNSRIEDAFADLGHHTAIDLWKDLDTKELAGKAEIRFVNKEDGLQAVDIAREKHWDAELLGPRDMDHEN
ncbi:nucleotide-binding alpha-beta plait domain-containing protein [Artemisia annua]|uniref:Nucleotide-binding alpha-beta plait domain-containing protein n=1 Tax=Artemisia annua TaxID=35608 RepID=A0A2U1Q5A6_ARTAN|nr:nucleotide-binding alpha-beta plait domain-containing protein [Artemisia annua]